MTEQPIPDALLIRAHEILHPHYKGTREKRLAEAKVWFACQNLASYLMQHEEAPVDPLLEIAREACAEWFERVGHASLSGEYRNGVYDEAEDRELTIALNAARRGYELGKGEAA